MSKDARATIVQSQHCFFDEVLMRRKRYLQFHPSSTVLYEFISNTYHQSIFLLLKEFLSTQSLDSIVLDYGCGDGKYSDLLCENGRNVVGVDISLPQLKNASRSVKPKELRDFVLADVAFLPFKDDSFDGIFIMDVLHHLSDFSPVRHLSKILKQQGKMLIVDLPGLHPLKFLGRKLSRHVRGNCLGYGKRFLFFSPSTLKHMLQTNGFHIMKEERGEYFIGFVWFLTIILPPFAYLLRKPLIAGFCRVEETLAKMAITKELCAHVALLCLVRKRH
jgi:SAM-dependent methyltransferase